MKNKITFVPTLDGLYEHTDLHPQPAKNFVPDWYKNMPSDYKSNNYFISKLRPNIRTAKLCPSFAEIFKEGFVLVAPCDIWLRVSTDYWEWNTPDERIKLDIHEDEQFLLHQNNTNIKKVFKLYYPWRVITPKGWSVRQIPLMWNLNQDWLVSYGVINSDVIHGLNQQILFTSDKEEVLIKKGTPLNYIVPFKREDKLKLNVSPLTNEYDKLIKKSDTLVLSQFKFSPTYYKNSN